VEWRGQNRLEPLVRELEHLACFVPLAPPARVVGRQVWQEDKRAIDLLRPHLRLDTAARARAPGPTPSRRIRRTADRCIWRPAPSSTPLATSSSSATPQPLVCTAAATASWTSLASDRAAPSAAL
jgi:hypothetical protein